MYNGNLMINRITNRTISLEGSFILKNLSKAVCDQVETKANESTGINTKK